jgi:hypothetical protein
MASRRDPSGEKSACVALNDWLRQRLRRRLNLALVAAETDAQLQVHLLMAELEPYSEMHVILAPMHAATDTSGNVLIQTLKRAAADDADAILIWTETSLESEEATQRLRAWLERAEQLGLCDRSFLALIGPHITRKGARSLGYDDGIPSDAACLQLATLVARETVAHDELTRRGSSPPCYL